MSGRLGDRIEQSLEQENAIDQWWASHGRSLKETLEQYKAWTSIELRKAQIQIAQLTEERDFLVRELLKLRRGLARMETMLTFLQLTREGKFAKIEESSLTYARMKEEREEIPEEEYLYSVR